MQVKNYYKPRSLSEALQDMQRPSVKALAGGTDIVIALNEQETVPDGLVDLSGVKELRGIALREDGLHICSMETFTQISSNDFVKKVCPMLAAAASSIGSPQVRNTGTIGGNLANAATAADTVPALMAADAKAVVCSAGGKRILNVTDIPTGLNTNCLAQDELICEFIIPLHENCFMDFEKVGRRKALAIARINMGIILDMHDGVIKKAAVAYGAVGKTAYRVIELEDFLSGKKLDDGLIVDAADLVERIVTEKLQGRKTTPYKRKIAAAVLRRALIKAREDDAR